MTIIQLIQLIQFVVSIDTIDTTKSLKMISIDYEQLRMKAKGLGAQVVFSSVFPIGQQLTENGEL